MVDQSYTVNEFCAAERISRGMLYKLWSQCKGPRFYYVGTVRAFPTKPGSNGISGLKLREVRNDSRPHDAQRDRSRNARQ